MHLKNIYDEVELAEVATFKDFLQAQKEGKLWAGNIEYESQIN